MSVVERLYTIIQPPPLDPHVQTMYQTLLNGIRRNVLIVLLTLMVALSVLFLAVLSIEIVFFNVSIPWLSIQYVSLLVLHPLIGYACIRANKLIVGWILLIIVNYYTTLYLMFIDNSGFAFIYILFMLSWSSVVLNWRLNVAIIITIFITTYMLAYGNHAIVSEDINKSLYAFLIIALSFMMIGNVIQRFLRRHALVSYERQRDSEQIEQRERELETLRQRVRQITMLKHDLLQPLRVVQGHLMELEIIHSNQYELIQPAMAAAYRAERLMSNLLDQARNEAQQQRLINRHTNLNELFERVKQALPGLVQYYEPRLEIIWNVKPLPALRIDSEQFERAIMNLLDNAMHYASTSVGVYACIDKSDLVIEIQDDGPGIPDTVMQKVMSKEAYQPEKGFGLYQVRSIINILGGHIKYLPMAQGTRVRLVIPFDITELLPVK